MSTDTFAKREEMSIQETVSESPFQSIPTEILRELFLQSLDPSNPLELPPRKSNTYPWAISQVCTLWRKTLRGIPSVWSYMRFRDDICDAEIPSIVHIFHEILSHIPGQISMIVPQHPQLLTTLVIPHLTRLEQLKIAVNEDSFKTIFELPGDSLHSLSSIDLDLSSEDFSVYFRKMDPFRYSPNLRKFTFNNNALVVCPKNFLSFLPWAQLTDIAFPKLDIPIPALHTLLRQCASLRTAHLGVVCGECRIVEKEITVPKLESLVLQESSGSSGLVWPNWPDWKNFLRPLILPSLRTLLVTDSSSWDLAAFTSLVIRSACPLESIELTEYDKPYFDNVDELWPFLSAVPSLRKLILPAAPISYIIFVAIHRREILPTLEHVECRLDPFGLKVILDLVESCISEHPDPNTPGAGLRYARMAYIEFHNYVELYPDSPLQEFHADNPLQEYKTLLPRFQEHGRDIIVLSD